ncbi:MAG: tRNA (adenosine(37)-N6)-threonylcarbamoyltransferase complex dimerization subunit type 1 TsaB [Oscillospiraceae bacterium]|nr:tRNA (adenosine(37)-N6)-threonylcarbamoyltransferase complex dimerization subunit type 1 TsaB [Oscillospiraceae bacterium]
MRILALETSAKSVSCALVEDGAVLAHSFQCTGLTHSRTLLPMVDAALRNAELPLSSVDCFAVSAGPGSFTGLRIGVSALKGLAWAENKPCVGVSTLYAMAQNLAHTDAMLVCAMDARRAQVYNALFIAHGGSLERICEDRAIGLDELSEELRSDTRKKIVLGDGAALAFERLTREGVDCSLAPAALRYQNAVGVALAAEEAARRGESVSAQELSISYLRVSQAERERSAKLAREADSKDGSHIN